MGGYTKNQYYPIPEISKIIVKLGLEVVIIKFSFLIFHDLKFKISVQFNIPKLNMKVYLLI